LIELSTTIVRKENNKPLTHAYVHWLADPEKSGQAVHLAGFAPAFTLSVS